MTESEPRIPTTPHVHECGIEGGTHRLCFCVVCNESYPNKKFVERAEPSRGAPETTEQFIAWWWAKYGPEVFDHVAKFRKEAEAKNVVLLEALRACTAAIKFTNLGLVGKEAGIKLYDAELKAEAAIKQAERT